MYLFSEKNLSDEYTVWWCGALTYLRTNDIFSQSQQYTASDMIQLKEVCFPFSRLVYVYFLEIVQNALSPHFPRLRIESFLL